MAENWEKELSEDLIQVGNDNSKSGVGRNDAMNAVSEKIAKAIRNGGGFSGILSLTVSELNNLDKPEENSIVVLKDSGYVTTQDPYLKVSLGDFVQYADSKWIVILSIPGIDKSSLVSISEFKRHTENRTNPHEVTAEQVGAYTKEQVTTILESFDLTDDALGRERELRDLIDSVAHGTNMVAFEAGQDVFMTILDYFARKPVPYAATFYSDVGTTTNTLTNVPPILVTDKQTAGFKIDCFCLFDVDSPGSDDKPDYARSILLEYTNNKSDAGYIKFLGRIGNSSHTRPTQPSNSYWEQFLNGKMCDGTFNYKSNKVATVKTVTDKINALDVNDAAVANQFVTAVKETDGKVSVNRRQPVIGDISGLQASLDVKAEKDEVSSAIAAHNASPESHEDIRSAVRDETSARVLYDSQLRESIEALEEKAEEFVTGEEVSEAVAAEADARIQEDIAINARIDMIPQTDWDEEDEGSMAYLQNHPTPISDLDIEALFS